MKKSSIARWWRNSKLRAFFRYIMIWKKNLSKIKYIFLIYLVVVVIASLFLYSPITHNSNYKDKITYWDALFTTCSAFSDTGLVMHDTYITWNEFGQALIAILIFVGGLGIFALKIFIINVLFLKNSATLSDIELVSHERGSGDSRQTKKLIQDSLGFLIIITIIFSFILSFYFYGQGPRGLEGYSAKDYGEFQNPKGNWDLSFKFGFFHCISALNNAGFDIIGQNSLMPYYHNYGLHFMFILLFTIGSLGYPVIHDFMDFIRFKSKYGNKRTYNWHLFTKISLLTYFITTLVGFLLLLTFEGPVKGLNTFWNDSETKFYGNRWEKTWALFFTACSTRSAGFATINMHHLSNGSLIILSILMFIGAAPASTGGGIRTTTLAVLFLSMISKIFGRQSVRAFRRRIDDETVKMSGIVFSISIVLIFIVSFIAMSSFNIYQGSIDTKDFNMIDVIFEVSSAFGTTGLTTGFTKGINDGSKIAMALLMFVGQFGISSTILVWGNKHNYSYKYEYISETLAIG